MSLWKLVPQVKNMVAENQFWTKGTRALIRKELYATATFECQTDHRPEIDLVNANGIELINGTPYAWSLTQLESIPNGPWVTWIFPDDMSEQEKTAIQKLIDVGLYSTLESQGWNHSKIEYWISGPLSLTQAI